MIRKNIVTSALVGMLTVLLAAPIGVLAQPAADTPVRGTPQSFNRAQLDQMLAPIALYPDSLLAQVLLASTYPSEVVQANRWVRAHRGWSQARINAALDRKDWDLSVKALVPFPKVLAMMDKHLDWTTRLGEAFLSREGEVMAQVQVLRNKAYADGNLRTTPQQRVVVSNGDIEILPENPTVVYVPYYNPYDVYGPWWWPGYPPYAFYPYAGPFISYGLFGFGAVIYVGPYWDWGWGHWNWHHRHLYVNADRTFNPNGSHPGFNRRTMRTENFHSFASHQVAGLGRVPGAFHNGFVNRPSSAAVRNGLEGAPVHGGFTGHGFAAQRPGVQGLGAASHLGAGTFQRTPAAVNNGGFRDNGFADTHPNFAAPGFSENGFRGPVGETPHFGGGEPHFGGGEPHFSGGAHFGGGGRR